jgi:hypothetical protein
MRQDLPEGVINHTSKTRSPYNSATTSSLAHKLNSHILISQDRTHSVIRLHWKYTKHRRHGNLFNPEWPSTSVLPGSTTSSTRCVAPGATQPRLHIQTIPPRLFIEVEFLSILKTSLTKGDHSIGIKFQSSLAILASGV